MVSRYVPDMGDLIWVDFDPTKGSEQAGHRPAVVLSPFMYNLTLDPSPEPHEVDWQTSTLLLLLGF